MEIDTTRLVEALETRIEQAKRSYNLGASIALRGLLAELRAGAFTPVSRAVSEAAFTAALAEAMANGDLFEGMAEDDL